MQRSTMSSPHPASGWRRIVDQPHRVALAPVRFVGFWSAVVLPLVLVSMLVTGLAGQHFPTFGALVVLNVVAAVAGRNYAPH